MLRLCFLICGLMIFVSFSVLAQETAQIPPQHPSRELEAKRMEAQDKKAELEAEAEKISTELQDTQKTLVDIASKIKKNEERLNALDTRIKDGKAEQKAIEDRLKKDKSSIGGLVMALERLDRTPPEAIVVRPGAPLETAQSAMLLQSILPTIYGRAENLKKDINRLSVLLTELEVGQVDVQKTGDELVARKKEISSLIKKRSKLYEKTTADIKSQEVFLQDIAAQAKNLKDLVERLNNRQKEEQEERTKTALLDSPAPEKNEKLKEPVVTYSAIPTPIPKSGASQLPVAGIIRVGYSQPDEIGAESQGLSIEARSNALVVSPMGGIVRYAGYFKNYGQIIIVEHEKDYHSLIAGLGKIDTVVGQSVSSGEPLGSLPRSSNDGGNPRLYYELRFNGEPVNPARKFAGL